MALILQLQALTFPAGTEFPGTPQDLLDLFAQYYEITGGETFNGINYGDTEPAAADRDKPWFKTDGSGNPIGWFSWSGAAWTAIPSVLSNGTTAERPVAPEDYTEYFDTTIGVAIVYYGGTWHTLSGSPGDIKQVAGTTLADVLVINPGWSHYTAGIGRVLAGAAADGSDAETDVGADTHTNTEAEMPAHTHEDLVVTGSEADSGDTGGYTIMAATQSLGQKTVTNSHTGSKGDGTAWDIRQQTRYVFTLIKD